MNFYTNVQMIGNKFLFRGYEDGKSVMYKEEFSPTLFVPSKGKTKYKTLEGDCVEPIKPGGVRDCRDFYKKYEDVHGFTIYGNDRYICQYISDKYPEEELKFDISKIKLLTLDIEVSSEYGFPDPISCSEEILCITVQDYSTKQIMTWGVKPFEVNQDNVKYFHCSTERGVLQTFLDWWEANPPEVITGWNVQLYDIPYICGRLDRVLGEKQMKRFSPWGLVTRRELKIMGTRSDLI